MGYKLVNEQSLTDIANELRSKNGTSGTLLFPDGFINAIRSIQGDGGESPLGEKMYSFAVFADIHLTEANYQNGVDDFTRAIPYVEAKGADFACISGDIGREGTTAELEIYNNLLDTYATIPYYACNGNHDCMHDDATWERYMGYPRHFSLVRDGDVFLFMSLDVGNSTSASATTPYTEGLVWLKEQLEMYKGARIFLFTHFPPSGYSGLITGQYYGFGSSSTQDDEIVTAINKTENVIMFHGHTHFHFGIEEEYDNINVYRFNASHTALVHVPSCSHPRNASMTALTDLSQAYIVEVYKHSVVLRGIDLVTGEYMPDYEYVLSIGNKSGVARNSIMVSDADVILKPGGSTTIEVYMSAGASTVSVTPSNSAITVSPATLTFTDGNYSTRQTVTITAAADVGETAAALVTLSADGLSSKVVSVTLSTGQLNYTNLTAGQFIVTDGDAYTGNHTGVQLEFTSGTYDVICDNLGITSSYGTIIHANDTDVNATIRFRGSNSFVGQNKRAMSMECDYPTVLIGEGDGASVSFESNYTSSAAIKGELHVYDLDVKVTSTKMPLDGLGEGFTLFNKGSFEVNGAKVVLLPSEHGTLNVNLESATPGTSVMNVDDTPDSGYVMIQLLVNGVDVGVNNDHPIMPAVGETMTIQGVFAEKSADPTPEVIDIPWVENYKIQSSASADSTDTNYMSTQDYIPIESGHTYELSVKTLGSYALRVMFYSGASYTNYVNKSDDIGVDVFPTQYSYTISPPSGTTHFRLRGKTAGDHQTWKDNIVLTKTKIY